MMQQPQPKSAATRANAATVRSSSWPDLRGGVSASDRERPLVTGVNGPLMARDPLARKAALVAGLTF